MGSLRLVHRWVGLALAVIVTAVAASGTLLLFRDPYYRARFPVLAEPITASQEAREAATLERIEACFGREAVTVVRFPRPGMNAYRVWLADGSGALVDPRTGAVITRWRWHDSLPAFLFELHAHLLSGTIGATVNGIAGIGLLFLAAGGVLLAWPRWSLATWLTSLAPRRISRLEILRSHAGWGVLLLLPILVFAGTGAAMVYHSAVSAALSRALDAVAPEEPSAVLPGRDAPRRSWAEIVAVVRATFADGEPAMFYPGRKGNAALTFRTRLAGEWHPNGRSYVLVNPYDATVLQAIDARKQGLGTRLSHAIYPVHSAAVGGWALAAVAVLAGAGVIWLSFTGVVAAARRSRAVAPKGRAEGREKAARPGWAADAKRG